MKSILDELEDEIQLPPELKECALYGAKAALDLLASRTSEDEYFYIVPKIKSTIYGFIVSKEDFESPGTINPHYLEHGFKVIRYSFYQAKLEQKEREIEKLKQHRAHTICPQCGNRGVFNSGIQLLDESRKKDERIAELESWLKIREARTEYVQKLEQSVAGHRLRIAELTEALKDSDKAANYWQKEALKGEG